MPRLSRRFVTRQESFVLETISKLNYNSKSPVEKTGFVYSILLKALRDRSDTFS